MVGLWRYLDFLIAAPACFYKNIAVGHAEAGLRTYNIYTLYIQKGYSTDVSHNCAMLV